ncbi:hypothetical protein DICPUDRAFT_159058 [Dictyostelium purpureum]|uniref:Vacuolar protein sorting-associated protein 52 homolog n=1 Tax=Dictyostelium purpureum TaxID=5786 RepID=F1A363_DICPU|nr:uncharacterized protein DICPUDRAFT_159058 [Dictyostelium purpureum]EGC29367.1 hypothetical protein DICPUDRAFT_159058 [Dictyostelium purpureum]|eukprot:XP_003294111.1 hypothetical protein DICPUDRAFT_159058 [Dictyostelium purpureum]
MASTPNRPAYLKQSSKLLFEDLKKNREDIDELGDLDITTILGCDFDDDSISAADQELIKDALVKGYDLRQYSKEVEDNLNQTDKLTINDYFQERENFLTLYTQIQVVDGVLETLEVMLNNYYNDLKSIGSEMNSLQERSMSMNHKLNNRKQLDEKLSKFIDAITIDPEFFNDLTNSRTEINEQYIQNLMKLDTKITLFDDYKLISPTICANNEPQLSKLTVASIQKIQKFLSVTLNSNFKKLLEKRQKQKQLAKMGYLFQFLFKYSQYIANEVIMSYVENNEKYFTSFYKSYINALLKLLDDTSSPSKSDLIGVGTSKLKNFFSSSNTTPNKNTAQQQSQHKQLHTTLSLGNRAELLSSEVLELPPIEPPSSISFLEALELSTSSAPQIPSVKYSFDQLYRSMLYFLMDILSSETLFVKDFFLGGEDIIVTIFNRSAAYLIETVENHLNNSYDVVGILLMLSTTFRYRAIMNEQRGIAALNQPIDKLLNLINSRFVKLFVTLSDSIKNTTIKDLKAGLSSTQPHVFIRKYADFIATLQLISSSIPIENQNTIIKAINELKDGTEKLLSKLVQEIESKDDQVVFLVNNYGIVVQTILESSNYLSGGASSPSNNTASANDISNNNNIKPFYQNLQKVAKKYIDIQLNSLKYLTQFISFSWEWGPLVESNVKISLTENPSFNQANAQKILASFEHNWRSAVAAIRNSSINTHLSQCSFAQNQVFDLVLTELYSCYRMLVIIIDKYFEKLKDDSNFKGDKVVDEMKEMNSNLNLKYIHEE